MIARAVSLDRVIAVDPTGDGYFPIPQLFVDFHPENGPFEPATFMRFRPTRWEGPAVDIDLRPDKNNRLRLFPDPLAGVAVPRGLLLGWTTAEYPVPPRRSRPTHRRGCRRF